MIRWLRILGPLALGAIMVWLMIHGTQSYLARSNPWDMKIATAKSILNYVVTEHKPLRMAVFPTDRTIRVISHLIFPEGREYDPELRLVYGMTVTLMSERGVVEWEHEYWNETRQSKSDRQNGIWLMECAFTTTGTEVSDERLTYVVLPEGLPTTEATLQIELKGWPGKALVRAYRMLPRTPLEIARQELALPKEERQLLAQRLFRESWNELSPLERELLLEEEWERIVPRGVSGADYVGMQIYFTGFHLPAEETPPQPGRYLLPGRALALNLVGPANVELFTMLAPQPLSFAEQKDNVKPQAPQGPIASLVEGTVLFGLAQQETQRFETPLYGDHFTSQGVLHVPAGQISSLAFTNRSGGPLWLLPVLHDGDGATILGTTPNLPVPAGLKVKGEVLQADERVYTVHRALPGERLRFPVFASPGGETLRVIAYPPFRKEDLSPVDFSLRFDLRDTKEEKVFAAELKGQATRSGFDDYPYEEPTDEWEAGQAQISYFRIPAGRYMLELESERALDLIVQSPACLYCEDEPEPVFNVPIEPLSWRNAAPAKARWMAIKPEGYESLVREGRAPSLRAQTRLDLLTPITELKPETLYEILEPRDKGSCSPLLEQFKEGQIPEKTWAYTSFTEIPPGEQRSITVPVEFAGRPVVLHYDLGSPDKLGRPVLAEWDGKKSSGGPARTVVGEMSERLTAGKHTIRLEAPGDGGRYWINTPVDNASLSDTYNLRRVCRMEAGKDIHFPVSHRGGVKQTVNILVYRLGGSGAELELSARLDQGSPRLFQPALATGLTPAVKAWPLPAARASRSILEVERGKLVGQGQSFMLTLYEEAAGGTHDVGVRVTKGGETLWVRAFVVTENMVPGKGYMVWKSSVR